MTVFFARSIHDDTRKFLLNHVHSKDAEVS